MCCSDALQKSNEFYGFDLYLKETRLGNYYEKNPIKARVILCPTGAFSGLLKTLLFPIMSVVGVFLMPIRGCVSLKKGNTQEAKAYFKATAFCLLGVGASIAFIAITGFHVPLIWSSVGFVGIVVVSITFHVYKMAKEPPRIPDFD